MPFGLDIKSLAIGAVLGFIVIPRALSMLSGAGKPDAK